MIDLTINTDVLDRTIKLARERNIVIPTFKQQRNPALIPDSIKGRLRDTGLWDISPVNLFRINWHNEPVEHGGGYSGINYIEFPKELTFLRKTHRQGIGSRHDELVMLQCQRRASVKHGGRAQASCTNQPYQCLFLKKASRQCRHRNPILPKGKGENPQCRDNKSSDGDGADAQHRKAGRHPFPRPRAQPARVAPPHPPAGRPCVDRRRV